MTINPEDLVDAEYPDDECPENLGHNHNYEKTELPGLNVCSTCGTFDPKESPA